VNHPLPWERLLWSGRPLRVRAWLSGDGTSTDFRLVRESTGGADEIAIQDVGEVGRTESPLDRVLGTSTVVVHARRANRPPFVVADVRHGAQMAAVLELISTDARTAADYEAIRAALAWEPRSPAAYREAIGAICAIVLSMTAVVIGLHGRPSAVAYAPDDVVRPNGIKQSSAEIARFMESDVMPWAAPFSAASSAFRAGDLRNLPRRQRRDQQLDDAGRRRAAGADGPRAGIRDLFRGHGRPDAQRHLRLHLRV
jgi:hypothetical protein